MLGTISGVRRILGVGDSAELEDETIAEYLLDAEEELSLDLGGLITTEVFVAKPNRAGNISKEFSLWFFPKKNSSVKVYLNGELLTSEDYELSQNVLKINKNLSVNDEVVIEYQSRILDVYCNYLACKNILLTKTINLPSGSTTNYLLDSIENKLKELKKKINQPVVMGWREHFEDGGVW